MSFNSKLFIILCIEISLASLIEPQIESEQNEDYMNLKLNIHQLTQLVQCGYKKGPFDCSELENRISGVYDLTIDKLRDPVTAYCDHDTDGGNWTVFQRRVVGDVNFDKNWNEYAYGFGNPNEDFWMGNDALSALTSERRYIMRVDLWDWTDKNVYAVYDSFRVGSADTKYLMTAGAHSGTAGDALRHHHNNMFSTHDMDNDNHKSNCAKDHHGGWWFNACDSSNLNGIYYPSANGASEGIEWGGEGYSQSYSFKKAEMKIRPA